MKLVCAGCSEPILDSEKNTLHIHHDIDNCRFTFDGDDIDKIMVKYAEHEMMCNKQIYFHAQHCTKCVRQMSAV